MKTRPHLETAYLQYAVTMRADLQRFDRKTDKPDGLVVFVNFHDAAEKLRASCQRRGFVKAERKFQKLRDLAEFKIRKLEAWHA